MAISQLLMQEDPAIKRRKAMAEQLMQTGTSTAPVYSTAEAIGRFGSALFGGYQQGAAAREERAKQQRLGGLIGTAIQQAGKPLPGQEGMSYMERLASGLQSTPEFAPAAYDLSIQGAQTREKAQQEAELYRQKSAAELAKEERMFNRQKALLGYRASLERPQFTLGGFGGMPQGEMPSMPQPTIPATPPQELPAAPRQLIPPEYQDKIQKGANLLGIPTQFTDALLKAKLPVQQPQQPQPQPMQQPSPSPVTQPDEGFRDIIETKTGMPKFDKQGKLQFNPQTGEYRYAAIKSTEKGLDKDTIQAENQLRAQFHGLTKDMREIQAANTRIQQASKDPSPAGDLALIFNYMKMLDPGSTVRESEFANAASAKPLMDRLGINWNNVERVWAGERLTPAQRQDFLGRAKMLFEGQAGNFNQMANEYRSYASEYGLNPDRIIKPISFGEQTPQPPAGGGQPVQINSPDEIAMLPQGATFITPDGKVRRKV